MYMYSFEFYGTGFNTQDWDIFRNPALPGQPVGVESHHWTFRQSEVDLEVDEVQKEALVQGQQLTNHLKNDERNT